MSIIVTGCSFRFGIYLSTTPPEWTLDAIVPQLTYNPATNLKPPAKMSLMVGGGGKRRK